MKLKHYSLKIKIGMKFNIPNELLMQAAAHAEQRGMTLEAYVEEFVKLMQESKEAVAELEIADRLKREENARKN